MTENICLDIISCLFNLYDSQTFDTRIQLDNPQKYKMQFEVYYLVNVCYAELYDRHLFVHTNIVRLWYKKPVSGFYASNHMCIEITSTKCDTYNIGFVIMTNLEMDWHHKR